jgi:2',3'-cyclic-nucleotide 2'-phosphodiesterase (5'-nucleotidase family)
MIQKINMISRTFGLLAATSVLTTLGMPVWLNAQITGDVQLTVLQTTDLHHHANGADHVGLDVNPVTGTSVTGAYARISAYVSSVRASAAHPVILVDSGDWTMGTLYDLTLASRPWHYRSLTSLVTTASLWDNNDRPDFLRLSDYRRLD